MDIGITNLNIGMALMLHRTLNYDTLEMTTNGASTIIFTDTEAFSETKNSFRKQ